MSWDFFISHAHEDKDEVARPLAELLKNAGYRVWLDDFELQVGDSIRAKIDQGLAHSAYGVVILSPAFFAKSWTRSELDALVATDHYERRRLLPVWHQLDAADVARHSPILAGRLAARGDVAAVSAAIVRSATQSGLKPANGVFLSLLGAGSSLLQEFLWANPWIVHTAVSRGFEMIVRPRFLDWPGKGPDFALTNRGRASRVEWWFVMLGSPAESSSPGLETSALKNAKEFASHLQVGPRSEPGTLCDPPQTIRGRMFPSRKRVAGPNLELHVVVVEGRRAPEMEYSVHGYTDRGQLGSLVTRSFDWLVDAANQVRAEGEPYARRFAAREPASDEEFTVASFRSG